MSLKDLLKKSVYDQYLSSSSEISVSVLLITLAVCSVLGLFLLWIYKFTFKGAVYNASFSVSLLLTGLVTSLVILPISSNLTLSLGMVGALSIVRYRTAVKDPRDIAYMFWAIGIGITCGAGFFLVAIAGTAFIAIVMVTFYIASNSMPGGEPCIGVFRISGQAAITDLKKALRRMDVKSVVYTDEYIELTAELPKMPSDALLSELRKASYIFTMTFVKYNGDYAI
ncbi:MAG: DUF4956 domain-containing protein [Eubacteriaceae bacterium]|nr:DUF4956 domain-containing protein [Eubacteriaceae bacterium]